MVPKNRYKWEVEHLKIMPKEEEISKKKQIKILKENDGMVIAPSTDVKDNGFIVKRKKQVW